MAIDIVDAVATYLQGAMGVSLASSTGFPQVYSDYAPAQNPDNSSVLQPYAVVTEGNETYSAQSEDHASTGYWLSNLATGQIMVAFYATTKAEARQLGRMSVRLLSDSVEALQADDGRVLTTLPVSAQSVTLGGTGVDQPTVFLRIVTFQYVQQFLE